jgi:hypothetical protein
MMRDLIGFALFYGNGGWVRVFEMVGNVGGFKRGFE